MVTLTAVGRCLRCDWTQAGDAKTVDRAAEKHTNAGHATLVQATPVKQPSRAKLPHVGVSQ